MNEPFSKLDRDELNARLEGLRKTERKSWAGQFTAVFAALGVLFGLSGCREHFRPTCYSQPMTPEQMETADAAAAEQEKAAQEAGNETANETVNGTENTETPETPTNEK